MIISVLAWFLGIPADFHTSPTVRGRGDTCTGTHNTLYPQFLPCPLYAQHVQPARHCITHNILCRDSAPHIPAEIRPHTTHCLWALPSTTPVRLDQRSARHFSKCAHPTDTLEGQTCIESAVPQRYSVPRLVAPKIRTREHLHTNTEPYTHGDKRVIRTPKAFATAQRRR
jgi:hypothetical protein